MDQRGAVQAIGGVNQKIEGFHDVCRARGLNGDQAVIIPASNVQHLMLREDVVESVKAGKFRVHAVGTIAEAMELLTSVPMGERQADGTFPEGSINARVLARLRHISDRLRESPDGARPATPEVKREEKGEEPEAPPPGGPPGPPPRAGEADT
jgi:predicted ATP-dependent protease